MSPIQAVQHIRRMRGGAQAQLLRASDGAFYVTKFQNCPQGIRVLANEFFASRLGLWLGLPMAQAEVIEVSDWLIDNTPELRIETAGTTARCSSGRQFGSRYVCDPLECTVFDHLPDTMLKKVSNRADLIRVLVLDKWTVNCDSRQAVFSRKNGERFYAAHCIDQGYCFNGMEWNFPDNALHGTCCQYAVYRSVIGWESFEPTLTRAEESSLPDLWQCVTTMPAEWYGNDTPALEQLVEALYERRTRIRDLIRAFRESTRSPFPRWRDS